MAVFGLSDQDRRAGQEDVMGDVGQALQRVVNAQGLL
jgi:hypothetical protein